MKKQSFLTGAVILMIANAISKILGAVFKIPLTYILNEDGMAVFNIAFEVYIMFLSFIISGLPFAISKMVAESNSRGEYSKTHRIVKISKILLVCHRHCRKCRALFRLTVFCTCNERRKGDICNTNDCTVNIFRCTRYGI